MTSSQIPLWINGERKILDESSSFEVRNPLTKKLVGICASASSQDCKDAVAAAGRAFESWKRTLAAQRRDIFLKAAELLQSDKYKSRLLGSFREEINTSEYMAFMDYRAALGDLMNAASLATQIKGETFPSGVSPGGYAIIQRKPFGAVLSIVPWNAPIYLCFRAITIPVICGNTVVLKSSELSPRTHEIIVELMHEAGLPSGVLNLVSMSKESAPVLVPELIAHPAIRHVNFTGSDRVGKLIAGEAAKYLKPCVLELGGKSPAVVLNDADINVAAANIASSAVLNSGQVCISTERVIVQRGVAEKFLPALKAQFEGLSITSENQIWTALAPEGSAENIIGMLQEAQKEGAEIIVGDLSREGSLVKPHLVKNVRPGMRIWDRETFGPVLGVTIVDTIDEAVELANATDYSLAGAVWTRDVNTAFDVASRIYAGVVSINGSTIHGESEVSFAGLGGASGYGSFDVDHFTHKSMVVVHPQAVAPKV